MTKHTSSVANTAVIRARPPKKGATLQRKQLQFPSIYLPVLISLHFMITGHIKFSPNAYFGLIKRKFCRTDVSSLDDLVEESVARNICQLVGAQDGSTIVPSLDWARFLSPHFRCPDGIKQCHHFRFERDHPGVVFLKNNLPLYSLPVCLLKDATTCTRRSGSTARKTYGIWCAQTDQHMKDQNQTPLRPQSICGHELDSLHNRLFSKLNRCSFLCCIKFLHVLLSMLMV